MALTRRSVEGLERYQFGIKKPSEIAKFRYGDVVLRAKIDGDFADAQFEQRSDERGEKLVGRLVPTVAVRRRDSQGFVRFNEDQVRDGSWLMNAEVDWRLGYKVFGNEAAVQRLETVLESQGVVPAVRRPLLPPKNGEITVEQEFQVTLEMQRALAKIVFNYLTYCEGPDYALLDDFDVIRGFIRYGEAAATPRVLSHEGLPFSRINAGDSVLEDGPRRPVVHFVSVGTNPEHRNVVGAITLFGFMTHRVMMAENVRGKTPGPRAHLYNVAMLQVIELGAHAKETS